MWLRVIKNSLFSFITQILILISSLVIYAIIGRKLGPDGLGQFSFILSFVGLFTFLPDLGINLFLIREIARKRENVLEQLGYSTALVLLLAPIAFVIIMGISKLIGFDPLIQNAMILGAIYLLLGTLLSLFRAVFQAFELMELETTTTFIEKLVTLVLSVFVLFINKGVLSLILVHVIGRGVALIISLVIFQIKISRFPRLIFDVKVFIKIIRESLPFALNTLTTTIYIQADLVLITFWVGSEASGYYKAATSLIIPLAVIATALNSAMFPEMARAFLISEQKIKNMLEQSIRYLFMISWPMMLGIIILAPQIIFFIYDQTFEPSILSLQILAIIIPLRYINNSMGVSLTSINQQPFRAGVIMSSALINLVLNIFMIPKWSYIGASYSTVVTEILISIALYVGLQSRIGRINFKYLLGKVFIGGLLMVFVTYLLRDINLFVNILFSAGLYTLFLLILKAFPLSDLSRLIQLRNKWQG